MATGSERFTRVNATRTTSGRGNTAASRRQPQRGAMANRPSDTPF
jgi:hypothetical protein